MADAISKGTVITKLVDHISTALQPTDLGGYAKTLNDVFSAAWPDDEKKTAFKTKLDEWEARLQAAGRPPLSTDRLVTVPAGAVKEFFVSPAQLSFDPSVSVKGMVGPLTLICNPGVPVFQGPREWRHVFWNRTAEVPPQSLSTFYDR